MAERNPLFIVIVGPTCSGKSNLSIELASRLNCEIVNIDVMQMFEGLDICTAKIASSEERGIRHHMLRFLPSFSHFDPHHFLITAVNCINDIHERGKGVIAVGGTGYYVCALMFKNFLLSESCNDSRETLDLNNDIYVSDHENDYSIDELKSLDPVAAESMFPTDRRRIKSSIQFIRREKVKRSDVELRRQRRRIVDDDNDDSELNLAARNSETEESDKQSFSTCICPRYQRTFLIVTCSAGLEDKINSRVNMMKTLGLRQELDDMWNRFNKECQTADVTSPEVLPGVLQSIGFKEFLVYLKNGHSDGEFEVGCERVKLRTWQYAKRQKKWIDKKLLPLSTACFPVHQIDTCALNNDMLESICKSVEDYMASDFCESAKQMPQFEQKRLIIYKCEMCNKTAKGEDQWNNHIRGKQHKALVKRKRKTEAKEVEEKAISI